MDDRDPKLCDRFEEALPALLAIDGDRLPPAEEEALLQHAASCPRCQELRRSYATTVDLLRGLPRKDAPADFLAWVRKESATPTRLPARWPGRVWLAAAAFLVLGFTAFLVVRGLRTRSGVELAHREVMSGKEEPAPPPPHSLFPRNQSPAGTAPGLPEEVPPPPDVAVTSPVEDGEAVGIVLNVEVPLPRERWEEAVRELEADLRARFEAPARKLEAKPPEDAAVALRSAREAVEQAAPEETDAASAVSARSADVAAPGERDLKFEVDASQLPFLVERVEGWARDAGASMRTERRQPGLTRGAAPADGAAATAKRLRVQLRLRPVASAKSP
jgi:hypothetical protein